MTAQAQVHIGCSGWVYKHWRGLLYPEGLPQNRWFHRYAEEFDTVEINASFYRPANPRAAEGWVKKVEGNPRFRFTAKLWRRFTHERATAWSADDVRAARAALDVLQEAGRLGAVLLQFPWSFKRDEASAEWLRDLLSAFAAFPLVVEVRHASWTEGDLLGELGERGVGIVNVDQPMFKRSIGG